jgi:ectoine hydroxylase-related dioxygenase (phytanoyl-CoA dioxygenase family)
MNEVNKIFSLKDGITQEHLDFYKKYGFVHFEKFLSEDQLKVIWASVAEAHKHIINNNIDKINGIPLKYGVDENNNKIVQRLAFTNKVAKEVEKLYSHPVFEQLKQFIPDYPSRLSTDEKDGAVCNYFVNVENSIYKQMGWHTDVLRDFLMLRKVLPMINVGVYFDDSGEENGGLRILTGTHTQSFWSMMFRKRQVADKKVDPDELLVVAKAGDLVLHDGRLWHRVAKSPHIGAKSRRRVMYIPLICGKQDIRMPETKTPFYHKMNKMFRFD